MNIYRSTAPIFRIIAITTALIASGCTTVSKRTVFSGDGIVVTHTEVTDHALKMSGHGSYILVINSAVVFGKEYPVLAGSEPCFFTVPERKLLFFVCRVEKPTTGLLPDRELHIINLETRSDTVVFLGQSEMGNSFGAHKPGSKYAERVDFQPDGRLQITTHDGGDSVSRFYPPTAKSIFVVSIAEGKLISETHIPVGESDQ